MIPGLVRNCSRTSKTTLPAARETALMASPEKKNTTEAPTSPNISQDPHANGSQLLYISLWNPPYV